MRQANSREVRAMMAAKGHSAWVEMTLRYGKTFRSSGLVVTCEPDAVRALLMEKSHTEVRSRVHKLMSRVPGANGILFLEGEPWLKRLKAVMPAFHRDHVDGFAASLHELTLRHAQQWAGRGRVPDLYDAVQQLGVASVLKMGYGLDTENPHAIELGRALVDYKQTTMNPDPRKRLDLFAPSPAKLLQLPWLIRSLATIRNKAARVREAVRALRTDRSARLDNKGGPGWLAGLEEAGLSDLELADEINHLYGAFNAIDYVVTAALYELARNPGLMAGIRTEFDSVLGECSLPARGDLARLPLTNGFMLEILRMYPVSMGILRRTGEALQLGGERFPEGTEVLILLHAVHHHPDFWDRPAELIPGRWTDGAAPKIPFSYVPFLDGSRKCIGRSMAEMQMMIILATLIRRYEVLVFADAVIPAFMIPRFARPLPFVIRTPLPA